MRTRPKARFALAGLVACSQIGLVAFAAAPAVTISHINAPAAVPDGWRCSISTGLGTSLRDTCKLDPKAAPKDQAPKLKLPAGKKQCPDSGPQVTCHVSETPVRPAPGVSSVPAGSARCPIVPEKQGPSTPASCSEALLTASVPSAPTGRFGTTSLPIQVKPSVPASTLSVASAQHIVGLSSDVPSLQPGRSALLTATASASVSGTPYAIEIFDQTTSNLVGACMQASQCQVAYTAASGAHTFAAFVARPTTAQPVDAVATSGPVTVAWLGVKLATSSASVVGPGQPVTFIATATADFGKAGYLLGLYDQVSGSRLTFCSQGTTCSTTLTKSISGRSSIVAYLSGASDSLPPPAIQAQSAPITATWLGVSLAANSTYPRGGATVVMKASANADLTNTPWSIGIYDEAGNLVSDPCKTGATCTARISVPAGPLPWFTAVIGTPQLLVDAATASAQLVRTAQSHSAFGDVQARSAAVQPTRLLWGVDSCKPITEDAKGTTGLYAQVKRYYGTPDFWGRYMTRTYNCGGLSSTEVAAAAYHNLGILPIYNDYDCNAVRTYKVGRQYAAEAAAAAVNIGIPQGKVIAIDIEPYGEQCPGAARVDAGFVEGWYDGIMIANYIPLFYGNGTGGSEFANAWCRAVTERPEVAVDSFLWTFQPSLVGRWKKSNAPEFTPNQPGCAGNFDVWQYVLSTGARPDVDSDEALSTVPFWYPQAES